MVIQRGIVIVHGVGESGKGDYIDSFVEPLAAYLGEAIGFDRVTVEARNAVDPSSISWATLHLHDTAGAPLEDWHIREAWWTRSFSPSSGQGVLWWGIVAGLTLLWSTFRNVFLRNFLRTFNLRYDRNALSRADRRGRPLTAPGGTEPPEIQQGLWLVAGAPFWKAALDAVIWLVITLAYAGIAAIGLLIIVPLYILLLSPFTAVFPGPGSAIQRKLVGILVRSVGDQQAMTTRAFALSAASDEVARALWPMLAPEGIRSRHRDDPTFTGFTTVSVVAHSGGCVVSFDALATQVRGWLGEALPVGLSRPLRINWVTAGSGLNLAFNMRRKKDPRERAFWERRLDGFVNWLNVYARYDPVPQGPAPSAMLDLVAGPDPWIGAAPAGGTRPPYVCLRVVNDDFPGTDHFGYWTNNEEVLSRLVAVIADDSLAANPIDPQRTAFPVTASPLLDGAIQQSVARSRAHRRNVLFRQLPLYLGLGAFLAFLFWASNLGAWALGNESFLGLEPANIGGHRLENIVPNEVGAFDFTSYRDLVVGAVIIAFVLLTASQLVQLFFVRLGGWVRDGGSPWLVLAPAAGTILAGAIVVSAIFVLT